MSRLPSELKLNILKYEGEYLGLSKAQIVSEIKEYEPTFNYDEWIVTVTNKEIFLVKMKNNPLIAFMDYLRQNKLSFQRGGNYFILIELETGLEATDRYSYVTKMLKSMGYSITRGNRIFESGADRLNHDLAELSIVYPPSGLRLYDRETYLANQKGYNDLVQIASILDMPVTLPQYLRYIIGRSKQENKIKKYKSYNLYMALNGLNQYEDYEGYIFYIPESGKLILNVFGIEDTERLDNVIAELIRIYGSGNINADTGDEITIIGEYPLVEEIEKIDNFYHPYMVKEVSRYS